MKFTINQKELLTALSICGKAIGNNIVLANNCYRLTLAKQLTVTACNNQVSISTKVDAKGDNCDFLMPSHIKTWVASLADQPLTFEVEALDLDYKIRIISASGNCDFVGYAAKDFPTINTDAGNTAVIDFADLTAALYRTSYSTLSDNTENVLNHLSLELDETGAQFVGYNGVIFALYRFGGDFKPTELMLPDAFVSAIGGLTVTGECNMVYSDKNISLTIGDIEVKSILAGGKYIAYKHGLGIPPDKALCNRIELINSIKRVLMFAKKTGQMVQLQFSQLGIQIFADDVEMKNAAKETVAATCTADLLIGFNGMMAIEALNHLSGENVEISYSDPKKWLLFHNSIELENDCYSMIAPMVIK